MLSSLPEFHPSVVVFVVVYFASDVLLHCNSFIMLAIPWSSSSRLWRWVGSGSVVLSTFISVNHFFNDIPTKELLTRQYKVWKKTQYTGMCYSNFSDECVPWRPADQSHDRLGSLVLFRTETSTSQEKLSKHTPTSKSSRKLFCDLRSSTFKL